MSGHREHRLVESRRAPHEYGSHRLVIDAQRDERPTGPQTLLPGHRAPDRLLRPPAPTRALPLPAAERDHRSAGGGHAGAGRPGGRRDRAGQGERHGDPARPADRRHRRGRGGARSADPSAVRHPRRGTDPGPAHSGLRPCAADAGRLLHPDPHRRPGEPAQQRRHRGTAGVQQHPVRCGLQRGDPVADPRGDAHHLLADHPARARPAAGVRRARAADGFQNGPDAARGRRSQRRHGHPDDRAFLGPRRDPGQALRAAGRRVRRICRPRGPGPGHRYPYGHGAVDVHHGAHPGLRAGSRARLRTRWLLRAARQSGAGCGRGAGSAASPGSMPR